MRITSNLTSQYLSQKSSLLQSGSEQTLTKRSNANNLPETDVNGISQINSDLPLSYAKLGEISVPGLKDRASLYKLSNGQKIVIQPKQDGPASIMTSFAVGALNETDEKRGISHFIEHNLFNGSKHLDEGEYDKKVCSLGGYTNAFTSFGETQYYINLELLDENSLEEAIKLNAYQTQFPAFPKEPLEREKEPVKSEIDMCSDNPYNKAYTIMLKNMFGLETNSEDIVIGTKENINNLTREDLFDYYNTWYTPDNAVTVITGDVDEKEAINLAAKYYNKHLDYGKINQRKYPDLTPLNRPSRVDFKQKNTPDASIIIGFPIDENTSKQDLYRLSIVFSLIASADSDISQKLDKYGVKLNFGTEQLSCDTNAARAASACLSIPDEYTEEVLKIIYDGITDLANNPPKQEDLNRIVNSALSSLKTNEYSSEISSILLDAVKNNDLDYFNTFQSAVQSLNVQDISDLAKKYLDLNKVSICVAHPDSVSDEDIIDNHKKVNAPQNGVSFGKTPDTYGRLENYRSSVEQYNLGNNMRMALIPADGTTEAHFKMTLLSDVNQNVSSAAADVLTELLNRGNIFRNNIEFSKLMRDLDAGIYLSASGDSVSVNALCNAENTEKVLQLIKQTLLNPAFSQDEFDRAKQIVKESLQNGRKSAYDKIEETLFPDNKMYQNNEEQLKELDKLTLDDVKKLYFGILNNSQALTTAAIPKENFENLKNTTINEFSRDLPVFKTFIPERNSDFHSYKPNTEEKFIFDTEENSQAELVQSYQYKASSNCKDQAEILILNDILGGNMSSRLFQDLRNNEKIAYHVASNVSRLYDTGMINLEIDTSTESNEASPQNITKALNAFKRNVEKLKTENVTQEELEAAKAAVKTSVLSGLEGSQEKASNMESDIDCLYGLNYNTEFLKAVDEITADDIRAAACYVFANPPVNSVVASKKTLEELQLN